MAGEKEYKVITKKGIDIAEIEAELERDTTSDAAVSANVPNRTGDVAYAKKANDRITHYMMTDAEAAELSKDPRTITPEKILSAEEIIVSKESGIFESLQHAMLDCASIIQINA